ncbi:MAG: D-sedoheptulose 7-phosphate isomerase [Oceanicoccus sp.]|jgi:D-sedoheptulose 7-phosphate isomerase
MDLDQQVIELFHSSIDTTMRTLDQQAQQVSLSSSLIVQCLLSEKKILCAGKGNSAALATIFCSQLINRFDYERPNLPAINLSADANTLMALTADSSFKNIFASQIRALGQSGDLLFIISNGGHSGTTLQAIKAAHDKDMIVVCLSDQKNNDYSALLQPEDKEIVIASDSQPRVAEVQLQIVNYISALIDQQLFGSH